MSVQPASAPWDQLQRAAEVLSKNWILALPTAVASLILSLILVLGVFSAAAALFIGHAAAGNPGMWAGAGMSLLTFGALALAGFLIVVIAQAIVMDASEDAWEGRPVDLGRSLGATSARIPNLIVAFIISALILVVSAALCAALIGFALIPL